MPEPLDTALAEVRALLLDPGLTRAVAAGRRRGQVPSVVRAELRPVAVRGDAHLQIVTSDGARPYTRNVAAGAAGPAVDALLAEPFGNWHVEAADRVLQLRVTKRGEAQVHRAATAAPPGPETAAPAASPLPAAVPHDRVKEHLLPPGDPLFAAIGGTAAKRRQVDAFLRALAATLPDDPAELPSPLRVVDLGCGNAYLTFAAYRYLTGRGLAVRLVGVDVRADQRERNTALAERLGYAVDVRFVAGTIEAAAVDPPPDVVLALHACDTATDEALARAVRWGARWVLAAPCCHHDIAAQLRRSAGPGPFGALTRHGILRERFADTLTDALRAAQLRLRGYRVDVVEFVDSAHTPRNLLLRARRTGAPPTAEQRAEYAALAAGWQVVPALARLLDGAGAGDVTAPPG
ncbi:MAG TPA: SAM-dependent methyltransferase [Pilimelia sp.]|nr:SAM-dependent methyltransferase [Pilimelia sp.]